MTYDPGRESGPDRVVGGASKRDGGRLPAVVKGQQERRLDRAVFTARKGELVGPVRTRFGYDVFTVTRIEPRDQQTLKEATPSIRSLFASQGQQRAPETFVTASRKRWKARTRCAPGYVTEDCGGELPPLAPPA